MSRRSYAESFVSFAQVVAEKMNLKSSKGEKVWVEKIKVRASAVVPQDGKGWLWMPITNIHDNGSLYS